MKIPWLVRSVSGERDLLPAFILSDGTFARPAALQGRTAEVGSQPYIVETVMTLSLLIALLAGAPSSESILAAADAFDRVQLAQDEKGMERMILDSFIFIDGSGKRQGKHAFIAGWLTPGDKYDPITLIDRTVTPLGDEAAVVSAETSLCGTSDGARFCRRIRFSDTFVRVDGEWRVAHVQVTRMPAD